MTKNNMPSEQLKEQLRAQREGQEKEIFIRLHRSISWYKAAEEQEGNVDLQFISLWISFNACYGIDYSRELAEQGKGERVSVATFLEKIVSLDTEGKLYYLIWEHFSSEVKCLIENKYVFSPFWKYQKGDTHINYEEKIAQSIVVAKRFLAQGQVDKLLSIIFDRLYMLRNQLFHGGATHNSGVNRSQVNDGTKMLMHILPVIIEIMIENHEEDWGEVFFPVVPQ